MGIASALGLGAVACSALVASTAAAYSGTEGAEGAEQICSINSEAFDVVMRDPDIRLWLSEGDGTLSLNIASSNPARTTIIRKMLLDVLVKKSRLTQAWPNSAYGL